MSERISGLSIGLTMDDASVNRSLSAIKDSFREVRSSAQVTMGNLKFDDKSVKSYKGHVQDLSKTFEQQQKNVDGLKSRYDALKAAGKENTQEGQRLRTEYYKQANELNKLGDSLNNAKQNLHNLRRENSVFTQMGNAISGAGGHLRSFGGQLQGLGSTLTRNITAPAMGAATAVGSIFIAKGFQRLVGIDTAQAKLKALGHDAESVDDIMDSALESVKGTSFGLGEAATVAASAVAAGIPPGEELTKYLTLTGDAAAIAGAGIDEMGSMINKVSTSGKAYTGDLMMLGDRGIPIVSYLAEELGVAEDAIFSMASKGEISSEMYLNALEKNLGGAAAIMGSESFTAALANTWAAVGRIGAAFLDAGGEGGGFFSQMKPLMAELTERMDGLGDVAADWGQKFGSAFMQVIDKIRTGVDWFTNLDGEQKKLIGKFALIAVAAGPVIGVLGKVVSTVGLFATILGPVVSAIGALTSGIITTLSPLGGFAVGFKGLASAISFMTGPIGLTIAGLTALGTGMVVAYQKSETFRNFIQDLKDRFLEFIPILVNFGKGIYDNFMGLVIPAVQAVGNFFQEMFTKIKAFWQSDGQQTIQAFQNAIGIIQSVVSFAMPYIQKTITVAFNIVLAVIRMVWENIKGVIQGSLNIIMGLVRVFTGLFTGDFSKMWEGVKNIFSGAIQVVWNGFQLLFYGRIIKGVGSLVRLFSGSIRTLWTNVVSFFQGLFTGSVTHVQSLFTRSNQIVNNLVSMFFRLISNMVQRVLGFFRNLFSTGTNIISNLRNGVTNTITGMRDNVVSRVGNLRDSALNGFRTLKDRGSNLVRELKDNAINRFNDMVKGARELPGKLGAAIKNGASKAVDGIKSLGNSMVNQLGKVVNGIIRGLNSITSKLGITATVSEWSVPKFSTGTGGSKGVMAGAAARFSTGTRNGRIANDMLGVVNDKGPGNGRGGAVQELIEDKAGNLFAPRGKDVTVQLDKGDKIYSGAETQSLKSAGFLPKFSQGTGVDRPDSRSAKKSKGVWGSMKDILANTFDYIKNPGKVMEAIISNITSKIQGISGFAMNMAKGGFNFIKDNALKFITDIFKKNEGGMGQGKRGKFMNYRMTTPYSPNRPVPGYPTSFNGGRHMGIDYGTPVGTDVNATLPGKVTKMSNHGGGLVAKLQSGDITQFFMHLSSVLKTGAVAMGDLIAKTGNSGAWTTGPHIHWQAQKGSQVMNRNTFDPRKVLKGHAKGGYIQKGGLFNLHDNEYVLPMNEPSELMKILALVGKDLAGKSKQTRQLPNVNTAPNDNSQSEIISLLMQQNDLLKRLLQKDNNTYLNGKKMNDEMAEIDAVNNAVAW